MKLFATLALVVVVGSSLSATVEHSVIDVGTNDFLLQLASPELSSECEQAHRRLIARRSSLRPELGEAETLAVKYCSYFELRGKPLLGVILGCTGHGELVIVDSVDTGHEYFRKDLDFPGMHANFGQPRDISGDGNPELEFHFSAGAHGYSTSFLSLFPDSASFIKIEGNGTSFFAPTGGIDVSDVDGDGKNEIVVDDRPSKSGRRVRNIYKVYGQTAKLAGRTKD